MKMPVLYVFGGEKAQGAEVVIERLMYENMDTVQPHLFIAPGSFADELVRAGKPYNITIVPQLKKLNRSSTSSLKYYLLAIRNYFVISYKTGRYLKKHHIHTVHANTVVPASYLLPVIMWSKLFASKLQWIWSDHDIQSFTSLDQLLSKYCVKFYHLTLVVSEAVKGKYEPSEKVIVLYNGLDPDKFRPDVMGRQLFRTQQQLSQQATIIGMPAVVHPRKGQLAVIEVFNKISADFPDVHLLFAGGYERATPNYSHLVKEAISTNKQIKHIGYVTNMVDFYNGCDIIINNSDLLGSEPLGTTIYEAMACEKIVVASITGGSPEIITDEVDGYLFEAENQSALERKLVSILNQEYDLSIVKNMARKKAINKFSLATMAIKYNSIIKATALA